jgi:drug/metabolite transporter (DMT)-like permease
MAIERVGSINKKDMETSLLEPTFDQLNPRYLLTVCIIYIIAAANEYWLVNWFKGYSVDLPVYFAIVQNASWPIQWYIYRNECKELPQPRVISYDMYVSYGILGSLATFIGLSRMYSLALLPPVLNVICANTEIVWESVMTVFILRKSVSTYQKIAVILVICGVFIALWDPECSCVGGGGGG